MRLYLYSQVIAVDSLPLQLRFINLNFQMRNLIRHVIEGTVQIRNLGIIMYHRKPGIHIPAAVIFHCRPQPFQRFKYVPGLPPQDQKYQKRRKQHSSH